MKLLKSFALLFALIIFAGCAGTPINKDVTQSLKGGKLAVAYAQLGKSIYYEELVYKVLWNETRTQDVSFDGLWDIDTDLSNYMAPKVSELGLNAVSIYDVAPKEVVSELHQALKGKPHQNPLVLSDTLRNKLLESDIDYLITVDSNNIYVYTQIGVKQGSPRTSMYVQDVRANQQKYYCLLPMGGNIKVNKSVREIESNNLEGLKSNMKEWLGVSVEKWMPKRLGLVE
jgi:hypothetical protein